MTDDNFVNISGGHLQGFIQENHGIVNQNFITQYTESISGQAPGTEKLTQVEYRQRKNLLSKVKEYWIKGVLEKSLHTKAMIELGLEERLDAVERRPFNSFEELPEESRQILPTGTGATEVFNQIGTLLILGEPGAGKTITLLKLAQSLIARAEKNVRCLIPVVFNLSSWGSKHQTIADWLVQELWSKYGVSKELGKDWVKSQQLLLLLDGLDEVKADRREACIKAINQFMQKHTLTEMVVCSRIADYEVLSNRLKLRGAIYIRALTPEQVNQYLDNAGEQLGAVKTLLTEDTALQELAKSPLTLSIMTLAYQDKKVEEIRQTGSMEERREHLFDAYIKRMFNHEKIGKPKEYKSPYQNQQAKSWLTWLGQRMTKESKTVFSIEELQPEYINRSFSLFQWRNLYVLLCFFITALLAISFLDLLSLIDLNKGFYHLHMSKKIIEEFFISANKLWNNLWQSCWHHHRVWKRLCPILLLVYPFLAYPLLALMIILVVIFYYFFCMIDNSQIKPTEKLDWSLQNLKIMFSQGLNDFKCRYMILFGFCQLEITKIHSWLFPRRTQELYLKKIAIEKKITINEARDVFIYSIFNYVKSNKTVNSLNDFELELLQLGFLSLFDEAWDMSNFSTMDSLEQQLVGMIYRMHLENLSFRHRKNYRFQRRRGLKAILLEKNINLTSIYSGYPQKFSYFSGYEIYIFFLVLGIIFMPLTLPIFIFIRFLQNTPHEIFDKVIPNQGIWNSLKYACSSFFICFGIFFVSWFMLRNEVFLILGILFSLLMGLSWGGFATIQHLSLRIVLWLNGSSPWNYARFLDYASDRIFLQKVGGGYIFVHRMLLEHFARME